MYCICSIVLSARNSRGVVCVYTSAAILINAIRSPIGNERTYHRSGYRCGETKHSGNIHTPSAAAVVKIETADDYVSNC